MDAWRLGLIGLMVGEKEDDLGESTMALYLCLRGAESACELCSGGVSQLCICMRKEGGGGGGGGGGGEGE